MIYDYALLCLCLVEKVWMKLIGIIYWWLAFLASRLLRGSVLRDCLLWRHFGSGLSGFAQRDRDGLLRILYLGSFF